MDCRGFPITDVRCGRSRTENSYDERCSGSAAVFIHMVLQALLFSYKYESVADRATCQVYSFLVSILK